jgi:arginase family enzyme
MVRCFKIEANIMTTTTDLDYTKYWDAGFPFNTYLEDEVEKHPELWRGIYRTHDTPEWAAARVQETGGPWRLLVIAEDWCGDASNTVPVLARLAEAASNLDLRIVKRDAYPDLMDAYLTNGSQSIPLAIVLDEDFEPVGRWGPRPAELQEFVIGEKRRGERPVDEIYKEARRWYARDGGETTLRELIDVLAAPGRGG